MVTDLNAVTAHFNKFFIDTVNNQIDPKFTLSNIPRIHSQFHHTKFDPSH